MCMSCVANANIYQWKITQMKLGSSEGHLKWATMAACVRENNTHTVISLRTNGAVVTQSTGGEIKKWLPSSYALPLMPLGGRCVLITWYLLCVPERRQSKAGCCWIVWKAEEWFRQGLDCQTSFIIMLSSSGCYTPMWDRSLEGEMCVRVSQSHEESDYHTCGKPTKSKFQCTPGYLDWYCLFVHNEPRISHVASSDLLWAWLLPGVAFNKQVLISGEYIFKYSSRRNDIMIFHQPNITMLCSWIK